MAGMNQGNSGIMSKVLPTNDLTFHIMSHNHSPLMRLLKEAITFSQQCKLMHIKIITNTTQFQKQQVCYKTNSVCWKCGYLLHGPPSTSKMTLIQLLASYLSMDLPVTLFSGTNDISQSITTLPILAIEDVDCGITGHATPVFGQFLNVLDGISGSGNGCIVVITTNHISKLYLALILLGWMDVTFKVGMPNEEQLHAAYGSYFCNCPEMSLHVDLEVCVFDFSCVPEDILDELK
jgi:hypothetical protein